MQVSYEVCTLPNCCGVKELGNFGNDDNDEDYCYSSPAEALKDLRQSFSNGVVFQAWFVRRKRYDGTFDEEYEYEHFRQAIRAIPGVIHLHTGINPNSGNEIDGYMWVNKK